MKRLLVAVFSLAVCGFAAFGQAQDDIVSVKVIPSVETFRAGQTAPVTLELTIRPPFHINSDQPSGEDLIGTTVAFKAQPGVTYGWAKFPRPVIRKLDFFDSPLSVFEGIVKITFDVTVSADFPGTEWTIVGTVGYQACDNQTCLPPTDAAFSKSVKVEGKRSETRPVSVVEIKSPGAPPAAEKAKTGIPAARQIQEPEAKPDAAAAPASAPASTKTLPKDAGPGSAPSADATPAPSSAESGKETPFEGKGLPVIFVLVFLGGLGLTLTPCVYPIIPITISYFGGQAEGKKGVVVLHAVFYVLGMAITYSILGVIAAFTGGLFGAALTYPPVLVAIALVMIALSLSMFDVYEFRMPSFLNKLAGGSPKGYFGTVLMGLTVGIVAAPCIGPFVLGLLTYVGNRGDVLLGFSLFFVLALGLGVPFLLLGIFSGSLNKLPRSGAWMVWVRKIFGFILLGMAAYFLKTLFPNTLFYSFTLALIMLVGGIYMGWIEPTKAAGKVFPYIRVLIGIVFLVLALVFTVLGVEDYIDETIAAKTAASGGRAADVIAWQPYSEDAVFEAVKAGKPVFIDSFADWCIPCKELDKTTFNQPEVVAASRYFIMLKSDLTFGSDEKVKAFYKKYKVRGVPTLVFLKPDGTEIEELRGTGFESKDVFLDKMKKALEKSGLK
ncbi:MAG: thioredoxin family protein [Candidatus Aminicenantes bacterium]|nr:thioredoxin family protein [Candidatus Aminicenantes bacterium]